MPLLSTACFRHRPAVMAQHLGSSWSRLRVVGGWPNQKLATVHASYSYSGRTTPNVLHAYSMWESSMREFL